MIPKFTEICDIIIFGFGFAFYILLYTSPKIAEVCVRTK